MKHRNQQVAVIFVFFRFSNIATLIFCCENSVKTNIKIIGCSNYSLNMPWDVVACPFAYRQIQHDKLYNPAMFQVLKVSWSEEGSQPKSHSFCLPRDAASPAEFLQHLVSIFRYYFVSIFRFRYWIFTSWVCSFILSDFNYWWRLSKNVICFNILIISLYLLHAHMPRQCLHLFLSLSVHSVMHSLTLPGLDCGL